MWAFVSVTLSLGLEERQTDTHIHSHTELVTVSTVTTLWWWFINCLQEDKVNESIRAWKAFVCDETTNETAYYVS